MLEDKKYIPPNEDTARRYKIVVAAFLAAISVVDETIKPYKHNADHKGNHPEDFNSVRDVTQSFIEACEQVCPKSADLSAAIRCIRISRMLANQVILQGGERLCDVPLLALRVKQSLWEARVQACAAIALAEPNELPDLE